jgi:copper resistance protein C
LKLQRTLALTFLASALIIGLAPRLAAAHAAPVLEQPGVGATIDAPPEKIVITFDAPIESLFAKLQVLDSSGRDLAAGSPAIAAGKRQLSVPLGKLNPGEYIVRWSVVAEDGHRTNGYYTFTFAPRR